MDKIKDVAAEKNFWIPGTPLVSVISAEKDTVGEEILRCIAQGQGSQRVGTKFGPWSWGESSGIITVISCAKKINITLKIGDVEGLFLKQENKPLGRNFSLRYKIINQATGVFCVWINGNLPENRIPHVASSILTWVARGRDWTDKNGNSHKEPYGDPEEPENSARREKKKKRRIMEQDEKKGSRAMDRYGCIY